MSKRVPIFVIGIIVLLLLVAPYGLGSLAESSVNRSIANMANHPAVSIEVTDYERGWFKSRATIQVSPGEMYVQAAGAEDPMMQMVFSQLRAPFVVELGHGPILTMNGVGIGSYALEATLDSEAEWVRAAMTTLDVPYIVQLRGQAGFGTGFRFDGDIPSFEIQEQGETVTFSGLDFSGHTDGRELTFESSVERLAIQSMFMSVTLEGLGLGGESRFRPDSFALGTFAFNFDRLVAINPLLGTDAVFGLDDVRVSAFLELNEADNVDYGVVYESASMRLREVPEFADVAFGIALTNLDSTAYAEIGEVVSQASAMTDPNLLAFQLLPIFNLIVATGPGLSIDPVQLSMDGGRLIGRINATIDPAALPTGQAMDLADPNVLAAAVNADLDMTVSKNMLVDLVAMNLRSQLALAMPTATESQLDTVSRQQAEQTIQAVVAQGMLADDGTNYAATIVVEDGIADVNGAPIPLAALGLF